MEILLNLVWMRLPFLALLLQKIIFHLLKKSWNGKNDLPSKTTVQEETKKAAVDLVSPRLRDDSDKSCN